MNNILVITPNWLGDAIFSTPVFKALKKAYPQARLVCLCAPRVKEVLDYCPYVDKVITYDEQKKHRWPWKKWKMIQKIRAEKCDAAFFLHRSMTRALMVFLAGVPLRIGYGKATWLLTHPVSLPQADMHRSDSYLNVLAKFGLNVDEKACELRLKVDDVQTLEEKLQRQGIGPRDDFMVFNTGGNWDLKRWPIAYFVELAKRVHKEIKMDIVLSGGGVDVAQCRGIKQESGVPLVVLAGETTLGESLVLYKKAKVVVSADSGPLHLAHSVGAAVVGIFGATRVEVTGPRGSGRKEILFKDVGCNQAPCYHLACGNNVCMQAVGVDDVLEAIKKFLC